MPSGSLFDVVFACVIVAVWSRFVWTVRDSDRWRTQRERWREQNTQTLERLRSPKWTVLPVAIVMSAFVGLNWNGDLAGAAFAVAFMVLFAAAIMWVARRL